MSTITKETCINFRSDLNKVLKVLEDKYGMSIDAGSIKYDNSSLSLKLTAGIVNEEGVNTAVQEEWNRYCHRYELEPTDFNRKFIFQGETFMIMGVKPRSTRYPILTRNITKNGPGTEVTNKAPISFIKAGTWIS